jgi:hypothetical protein
MCLQVWRTQGWHGALLPPVLALMAEAVAEITRLPIWQHPRAGCHNLPTMSSACTRWHTEQPGHLSAHGPVPACPRQRLRLLRVHQQKIHLLFSS